MNNMLLFCFPYAGGSESIYYPWRKHLLPGIELLPIPYAGRGTRFRDTCYKNMDDALCDLFEYVKKYISGTKYSFFGHSMGGLIAYELCRKLEGEGVHPPKHVFVSGVRAPNRIRSHHLHQLPEEEFKKKLDELNGTPKEVLHNRQLMEIFLPILRSDFRLIEEYAFMPDNARLNANITALYGKGDDIVYEDMIHWKDFTKEQFGLQGYPGGHFFINDNDFDILHLINETLAEH
ncbi:thioesterase II family protein [Paenibacillus sepulcri]|uniref:Thioesterase n=1 Tax=Paenibacillus sepulcri TaxID=359917 RepID=A0ABS7BX04_9BACL|nr:thioesterase [Paenibacillus sepulcri]